MELNPPRKEAIEYLKSVYEDGYGYKLLCRYLEISYTQSRRLFVKWGFDQLRTGCSVVTDSVKRFRSDRVKGKNGPAYGKVFNSNGRGIQGYYLKSDGSFIWLRSTWEYIFAKWLDKNNITWEYEKRTFKLSDNTTYRPDFFLSKNCIVEIKSKFYSSSIDRLVKAKLFEKEYPQWTLIIVDKIEDYTEIGYQRELREWKKLSTQNALLKLKL